MRKAFFTRLVYDDAHVSVSHDNATYEPAFRESALCKSYFLMIKHVKEKKFRYFGWDAKKVGKVVCKTAPGNTSGITTLPPPGNSAKTE